MHKHSAFVVLSYTLSTHICGQFLPFCFAEPLVLHQAGWGTLVRSHFQILPTMFNWLQAWALTGHSRTFTQWPWGHFFVLAVCLGWLSCQNMKLCPSLRSRALWSCLSSAHSCIHFSLLSQFLPWWRPLCLLRPSVPLIFFCTLHIYAPTNHYWIQRFSCKRLEPGTVLWLCRTSKCYN